MQRTNLVRLGRFTTAIFLLVALTHVAISLSAEYGTCLQTFESREGEAPAEPDSWHRRTARQEPRPPGNHGFRLVQFPDTLTQPGNANSKPARVTDVLIYYANETAPDDAELESWETILGWLDSSDKPKLDKIARQLRHDRRRFPEVVDQEVVVIQEQIIDTPAGLTAVVFTNRLVRNGKYLIFRGGDTKAEEGTIEPLPSGNFILTSNPLARADMFARGLSEVAKRFDPTRHNFVLVTTSHGNTRMAMTPRLCVRAAETTREELLAVGAGQVSDDELPSWADRLGVTKDQYFDVLGKLGQEHGMQFDLVFMLACNGTLDDVTIRPPKNVRKLYMTGPNKAAHGSLDYVDLLALYDGETPLADIFERELAPRFPVLVRGDGPPSYRRFPWHTPLYWLPLAFCLASFVWRRRGRSGCA